jgi:hypothetical protein
VRAHPTILFPEKTAIPVPDIDIDIRIDAIRGILPEKSGRSIILRASCQ